MRIAKLAPSTKVKGRWLAHLEDGRILRVGEHQVADFALHTDMELPDDLLAELTAAAQGEALRAKALGYIAARPLSRRELIKKLTGPEEDPAGVEAVADWLEALGYLNDEEYAKTLVRHYAAKGYGEGKLRDELYRRGVPREHWDGALEENEGTEGSIDAFLQKKLAGRQPDLRERKRVSDALARRGFRWEDISAGLRRYGAQTDEE